jgi:4-amino-4-deoxy-L-arabinose transferase-like glycosyltransferase
MLFWLFHAGWAVFGVNEWWPRLVPPLFALAGLYLTQLIAKRLWPERPNVAIMAPWILGSCMAWAVYTSTTMFDMLLMAMVLLGVLGLLRASRGQLLSGWLLIGVASGLGILIKGPVMLLHLAFPMLLAPWWSETARRRPGTWYVLLLASLIVAAAVALAWALPAAKSGGPAYEQAILWHQTADRMVHSFAHSRPFWWYLPMLPILLAPWLIWPVLWRAVAALRLRELNIRLLLTWMIPTFIAFCFVSGKQIHYLFPIYPAFALLAARALDDCELAAKRRHQLLPALLMLVMGIALLVLPYLHTKHLPDWAQTISPFWGSGMLLIAVALLLRSWQRASQAVIPMAVLGTGIAILLMGGLFIASRPVFDIEPAAKYIAKLQQQGHTVANVKTYHDQFQFLGRLKKPLVVLKHQQARAWAETHRDDFLVRYTNEAPASSGPQPVYAQRYRGGWLSIWPARLVADAASQATDN